MRPLLSFCIRPSSCAFVSRSIAAQTINPRVSNVMSSSSSSGLLCNTRGFHSTTKAASSEGIDILSSFNGKTFIGKDVPKAMETLANADAVCFDVDSTVIQEEGIDVLADFLGKGPEVSAWTSKAMDGGVKFEDALAARLNIIKPSKNAIEDCLQKHPLQISPGIDKLIRELNSRGTDVYFVSGGFRIMIEPLAKQLMVSKTNIYANTLQFEDDTEGSYKGFDNSEPTSADQGKPRALTKIKEEGGYKVMVMVGDGATDAQAKPPADAFIGFGGVVERSAVREKACWFVHDFEDMISVVIKHGQNKLNGGEE